MTERPGSRNRSSVHRPDDDFYPTPREAIVPLLNAEQFQGPIWECACGDGAISEVLKESAHTVVSTNLLDRGYGTSGVDFLTTFQTSARTIITNPPSSLAIEFVLHAIELEVDVAAFLLRTKFLEGARRHARLFNRYPPNKIHQFIERIVFYAGDTPRDLQPGWSNEAFAWFIWRRPHRLEPVLKWIHADAGLQGKLL